MMENEEAYFRQAVAGARAYKETFDTASSLEWIDDLGGIAINGSHEYSIKALRELDKLTKSESDEISAKAKEALELALEMTKV